MIKNKKVTSAWVVPTWRDQDNDVRLYDPNEGKGRELYGVLQSVNESGASLRLEGKAIRVLDIQ